MKEYGYINEGGYLHSRVIESYQERFFDGKEYRTREISEEAQIEQLLALGWKPVEDVDQSKTIAPDGYVVRLIPYDAGDCIKYHYDSVRDVQKFKREIEALKQFLTDSDYKIIKCYEATIAGEVLPYDFASLRVEREEARCKINELEIRICEEL